MTYLTVSHWRTASRLLVISSLLLLAVLSAGCGQRPAPAGGAGGSGSSATTAQQAVLSQSADPAYIQQLSERGSLVLLRAHELERWVARFQVKPEVADDEIETAATALDEALAQGQQLSPPSLGQAIHEAYRAALDQLAEASAAAVSIVQTTISQDEDMRRAQAVEAQLLTAISSLEQLMLQAGAPIIRDEEALIPPPPTTPEDAVFQPPTVTALTSKEQLLGSWHGSAVIIFGMGDIMPDDWRKVTFHNNDTFQTNTLSGFYTLEPGGQVRLTVADSTFVVSIAFPSSSSILGDLPEGTQIMELTSSDGGGIVYIRADETN